MTDKQTYRPFGPLNYVCMGICLVLIIAGFALMAGPGSTQDTFNPDIFSTRRIVVGPLLAFLGFLFMAFAIIVRPDALQRLRGKKHENTPDQTT